MNNSIEKINKIFIKKMAYSFLIQLVILSVLVIVVRSYVDEYLIAVKKYTSFLSPPVSYDFLLIILSAIVILIINYGILFLPLKKKIETNTHSLLDFISHTSNVHSILSSITIEEYQIIANKFIVERQQITLMQKEQSYHEARKNIAEQVAHDIRSPLAAINTVTSIIPTIPENQRRLIKNASRRINEIANNLADIT